MSHMHEKLTAKTFLGTLSNCPFYAKKFKEALQKESWEMGV